MIAVIAAIAVTAFFLNTLAFQLLLRPSPNSGPLWAPLCPLISATSEPLSFASRGPLMTWELGIEKVKDAISAMPQSAVGNNDCYE